MNYRNSAYALILMFLAFMVVDIAMFAIKNETVGYIFIRIMYYAGSVAPLLLTTMFCKERTIQKAVGLIFTLSGIVLIFAGEVGQPFSAFIMPFGISIMIDAHKPTKRPTVYIVYGLLTIVLSGITAIVQGLIPFDVVKCLFLYLGVGVSVLFVMRRDHGKEKKSK